MNEEGSKTTHRSEVRNAGLVTEKINSPREVPYPWRDAVAGPSIDETGETCGISFFLCAPYDVIRMADEFRLYGMNLASPRSSMQKYLSVKTHIAGMAHINRQTGHIFWEEANLDPVVGQYAKNYLVEEGFLEQALGILDPQPSCDADLFLDEIGKST
jgi:hypothetical protein